MRGEILPAQGGGERARLEQHLSLAHCAIRTHFPPALRPPSPDDHRLPVRHPPEPEDCRDDECATRLEGYASACGGVLY